MTKRVRVFETIDGQYYTNQKDAVLHDAEQKVESLLPEEHLCENGLQKQDANLIVNFIANNIDAVYNDIVKSMAKVLIPRKPRTPKNVEKKNVAEKKPAPAKKKAATK